MKLPGKQLLTKAIFSVAVVASTATVGLVGFAQAAQPQAGGSGYGGGIGQLLAALDAFRQSVQTATAQYRQDVNVCLEGAPMLGAAAGSMQSNAVTPDESQAAAAKNTFSSDLDQTVGALNGQVGNEQNAQQGKSSFERNYANATNKVFRQLDDAQSQLAANMSSSDRVAAQQGGLFSCLDKARNKYQRALDTAKATFLAALKQILG